MKYKDRVEEIIKNNVKYCVNDEVNVDYRDVVIALTSYITEECNKARIDEIKECYGMDSDDLDRRIKEIENDRLDRSGIY